MKDDDPLAKRVAEARPELDPLARKVGYARVAAALFGEAPPVTVGRYRLERQLGRGGSGFVFTARDPELHRDVAVKLIRATSDRHRERALAEARALAKLSHPNVVPVHDVGATAEHVYLVMELLRGQTLRAYAENHTVREIVAAYRQVAAGLAAAHAAGLVHRDVKPDNAMLGDDGRPRVVDFGLAAEDAAGGTPRYMSPEQRDNKPVTAATDQYALAVSLSEALAGAPPAWLARVITRATADDPAARYPSMQALERALADDPRTRWTKRALVAAPIVLAIAGFAIGQRVTTSTADDSCAGGPDLLASSWTPTRGADVAQRVAQLGTPYALSAAAEVRTRTRRSAPRGSTPTTPPAPPTAAASSPTSSTTAPPSASRARASASARRCTCSPPPSRCNSPPPSRRSPPSTGPSAAPTRSRSRRRPRRSRPRSRARSPSRSIARPCTRAPRPRRRCRWRATPSPPRERARTTA